MRRRPGRKEFVDEVHAHLALETDRLIEEGMAPDDARRVAAQRFGSLTAAEERFQESQRIPWIDAALQDVRTATRSLRKSPVVTLVAVLSLAFGIGTATVALLVRQAFFVNPPPLYEQPGSLSTVEISLPEQPRQSVPAGLYARWAERPGLESRIAAALGPLTHDVRTATRTQTLPVWQATPELFALLGVRPARGRSFADDLAATRDQTPAILSHRVWRSLFDERTDVVGQTFWIADRAHVVVGVMPQPFWFQEIDGPIWTPLDMRALAPDAGLRVVVRRAEHVNPDALRDQLQGDATTYTRAMGSGQRPMRVQVYGIGGTPMARQMARVIPWLLAAAVLLTLLIACANVAILAIAQWTAREHEIAIRASLGASRGRIVRQLLVEAMTLAVTGGILGMAVMLGLRGFVIRNADDTFFNLALGFPVYAQAVVVTLLAGIVAGLGPALVETRHLRGSLLGARSSERVRQRWRHALVVFEIAVTVALLVVATTLLDAYGRAFDTPLGFDARPLVAARVQHPEAIDVKRWVASLERMPGVASVAAASNAPFAGGAPRHALSLDPAGSQPLVAARIAIEPGFFDTLGVPLRGGRGFTELSGEVEQASIIVNETAARRLMPAQPPVGRTVWVDGSPHEVIGVVADYSNVPSGRMDPAFFVPLTGPVRQVAFLVRVTDLAPRIAQTIRLALSDPSTGNVVAFASALTQIQAIAAQETLALVLPIGPLIVIGLFMTAAGIYGVLAFVITRRSKELAVRVAIGATRRDLLRLITLHSARLLLIGAVLAVAVTFGLTRLVRASGGAGSAFDTPAWPAFAVPVLVVFVVGAIATWLPTRRAMKINPAELLNGN